ncbi:MAG: SH3 domain-containing protein [Candidatus Ventricola sp.]
MIKADDAIRTARSLIGTPYAQLDCINLIKKVIRTSPGGVPGYTTAGTNTLWNSYNASAKYRDLIWRQVGLSGAKTGMLTFKQSGNEVPHIGLVTEKGTVIHSSSVKGRVVETNLYDGTWKLLAVHRYIRVGTTKTETNEQEENEMAVLYQAVVHASPSLRLRAKAETGKIIGHIPDGETIDVLTDGDWPRVRYHDSVGYVSGEYLERVDDEPVTGDEETEEQAFTTLIPLNGGTPIMLVGRWRVAED